MVRKSLFSNRHVQHLTSNGSAHKVITITGINLAIVYRAEWYPAPSFYRAKPENFTTSVFESRRTIAEYSKKITSSSQSQFPIQVFSDQFTLQSIEVHLPLHQ